MTLTELFTQIANAIRTKKGTTAPIVAEDFPTEIGSIETGEDPLDYFAELTSGTSSTNISNAAAPKIIKKIPDNIDIDGTSLAYGFRGCSNLEEVGMIDTSEVTNMQNMFVGCRSLTKIPQFDTSSVTNMSNMFSGCIEIVQIPQLDTSSVTDMSSMFSGCEKLETVPLLDMSSVTTMTNMFNMCDALTDTSLNNILQMCVNATNYTGTKTLTSILSSHSSTTYTQARIEGLSNYSAFTAAGWTTGY